MTDFGDRVREAGKKAGDFAKRAASATGDAADAMRRTRAENAARGDYMKVREHPKGTKPVAQTADTVTVRFKAAIRFWWKLAWGMVPLCIFSPFLGAAIGFAGGAAEAQRYAMQGVYYNPGGAIAQGVIFTTLIVIVATVIVFRVTRPWVELYADRDHIRVGKLKFDRRYFGNIRLGYEINSPLGMLKNDFHDLDIGLQGLRLVYGPWGEDLQVPRQ